MNDSERIARAKAGDFEAFDELVSLHERKVYSVALNILRNPHDAEDVVQTAFMKALEKLDTFREEAAFGTWVTRIAVNTAINIIRKRKGLTTVPLQGTDEDDERGDIFHPDFVTEWSDDPSKKLERKQLREILDRAIADLDEKYRVVFALRDIEGMNVAETAEILGLSKSNVKVRLLRARLMLRETLTQIFGDPDKRVEHKHNDEIRATDAQVVLDSYRSGEEEE